MQDFPDVDSYIDASDQWPDEIAALRPLLLASGLDERIRWGKPCYGLGDANIVLVQKSSDHLALLLFKGILLADPAGVLEEQGPNTHVAMRMTFGSVEDVQHQPRSRRRVASARLGDVWVQGRQRDHSLR